MRYLLLFFILLGGIAESKSQNIATDQELNFQLQQQEIDNLQEKIVETEQHLKELQEEKEKQSQLLYERLDSRLSYFIWAITIISAFLAFLFTFLGKNMLKNAVDSYLVKQAKKITSEKINSILTEDWLKEQVVEKAQKPIQIAVEKLEESFRQVNKEMLANEKTKIQKHQDEAKIVVEKLKKQLINQRRELERMGLANKSDNLNFEEKQKLEDFEETLETSKAESEFTAKDWFWKAYAETEKKNMKSALKSYTKAIELDPDNEIAWSNRGYVKFDLKEYKGAIEDYNQALKIDPKNDIALVGRGHSKIQLGLIEEALEDLNKAIETNPNSSNAWSGRGHSKIHLGQYREALKDLDKAIEANPNNSTAWNNRGACKNFLGNFKEAVIDLNQALRIRSNMWNAFTHRSYAYLMMGDLLEAERDINKALELKPQYDRAYYYLGLLKQKQSNQIEACTAWKKALELGFNDAKEKLDEYCKDFK